MKTLFAVVLTIALVLVVIECKFEGDFGGPPFGNGFFGGRGREGSHHRDPQHRGRNSYTISAIIRRMGQMEGYVEKYMDRAISVAEARNSSYLEVLQEIRNTDLPQLFNNIEQKLSAAQNSTSTPAPTSPTNSSPTNNVSLSDL